ncbi:MmgE/PrpD family protein [Phreatobacter stygius]|nr:MmgE/PrpD family protein [Phreatobacter stygius]
MSAHAAFSARLADDGRDLPLTRRLAGFIGEGQVDAFAQRRAVAVIVDTLAVTIAGGAEPAVRLLARSLDPRQDGEVASLWGAAYRADDAALLFGMASHILDYDDVSMLAVCHPTAPVLSAALSAVPWHDLSGRDLADAVAIGTEVMIRLGQAMGFRHYALGFHATATLGTIGATAAAARLMRLDQAKIVHALAIAASLASGLRKNFGSMVKSLHVGLAASNGLKAARWAAAGIEGAAEPLEQDGFLRAFSGGETDRWPSDLSLGSPFVLTEPGFEQKRYPCCYLLHRMIEATLAMVRETGVGLADVAAARVDMPPGGTRPLIHPFPKSGLNALFSAPYAIVASLADRRIDLKSFTDAAVLRPEIQARLGDVDVVEAAGTSLQGADVGSAPVTVTLTLRDGARLAKTILVSPGSVEDPLTPAQLEAKWTDCLERAAPGIDSATAARLFAQGFDLAALPRVSDWLAGLRHAVSAA